jgi:signal transduction histidine kinase
MAGLRRALAFPRGTARLRLALLYGGAFLLLGTVIIAIIFGATSTGSTIDVSGAVPQVRLVRRSGGRVTTLVVPGIVHQQKSADNQRLLAVSWLVLVLTALASTVLGWFIAGRVLRPLRQMDATARTISAGNLSRRLALGGRDDEFKRLGDTLDDLLARLEASFEAQRRFVANASHELRTPMTVDRTLLQVALADPDVSAEKLRATCEELLASGREQERLLEALLTLASSERGLERQEPVDLADLADQALLAVGAGSVTASLAPAPTSGDPALIERLITNLLDNALRYNDDRGIVEITTGGDDDEAYVAVVNTGPVVPESAIERLFEPFQRLGERTAEADGHHGLGLSIVRAIATAHGALVDALPREGGGLAVTVSFTPRPIIR